MKLLYPTISLFLIGTCLSEVRPATTKEDLLARKAALANSQQGKLIRPVEVEVTLQTPGSASIMETSSFLVGSLGYTLIPNGSATNVEKPFTLTTTKPENLRYMDWDTFAHNHRSRIQIVPVPKELLKTTGDSKVIRDRISSVEKLGITCVTTYKNLPVRISKTHTPS